jgi:hypothetical protein
MDQEHFICHKTSKKTGDGTNLLCAGAISWQAKRDRTSILQRVMEAIERNENI